MFSQEKTNKLKVGDLVVIGCSVDGKFVASTYPTSIKVERIWEETPTRIRVDLDWGSFGKSKIYAKDEGIIWKRVENFN
jgi:hypothetical protein